MRPGQDGRTVSHRTVDNGRLALARVNMQLLRVAGKHFYPLVGVLGRIDEDAAAVVVALEGIRDAPHGQRRPRDLQLSSPGPFFRVIHEAGKGAPSCYAREEGQLSVSNDLELLVAHLELAPRAAVVAARAEAEIAAAALDELLDAPVPFAVQGPAVRQVSSAGHHEEGAGGGPGLADDHLAGDGDDGVVGRQDAAQGVQTLPHGVHGRAIAWRRRQNVFSPVRVGLRTGIYQDVESLGGVFLLHLLLLPEQLQRTTDRATTMSGTEKRPQTVQVDDDEPDDWYLSSASAGSSLVFFLGVSSG